MLVYVAYTSLVVHVVLGILQSEQSFVYVAAVGAGIVGLTCLHTIAAFHGRALENEQEGGTSAGGFVDACALGEIKMNRAKIVTLSGERVAVFKYTDEKDTGKTRVCAVSNVCQHQNGPLGEGKFVDGCITCPWHGYQYLPQNGSSPPPFSEKIPTFRVKVVGDRILVDPQPLPAGTESEPATIES
jgi:nitrite reductase/ring-hydroxylating ferredoxin subunit